MPYVKKTLEFTVTDIKRPELEFLKKGGGIDSVGFLIMMHLIWRRDLNLNKYTNTIFIFFLNKEVYKIFRILKTKQMN